MESIHFTVLLKKQIECLGGIEMSKCEDYFPCTKCGFDHKTSKHEEEFVKCDRCSGETVLIHNQDWQKSECLECGFEELK